MIPLLTIFLEVYMNKTNENNTTSDTNTVSMVMVSSPIGCSVGCNVGCSVGYSVV